MSHEGGSCQGADAVHDTAAPAAQSSMQGLAWQLASALGARTVSQPLSNSLRQAVPAALGIRLCLRIGAQHLATSSNLLTSGELGMLLTPATDKCMASRCVLLGELQLCDTHKQQAPCSGSCRRSLFVPVAQPSSAGCAALGCLIVEYVCSSDSAMRRCLPEVADMARALSEPLLVATGNVRTQLAAAAAVLSQPQTPMLRAAMLSSIPEGGLPPDAGEDAVSESPSQAERLALLAELTDAETDSEADVQAGTGSRRRRSSSAGSDDEEARPSCREEPGGSWRDDEEGAAPALPVVSPSDGDMLEDALPPPTTSDAHPPEQDPAWPPHGSELWRSSFQAQRDAAADTAVASPAEERSVAAAGGATAKAAPSTAVDSTSQRSAADDGASASDAATPTKPAAAAAGGLDTAPPSAAAMARHPLWLTFADPTLEQAFIAWNAKESQLWDIMQLTMLLVNIVAKSAPYWRVLPPHWYPSIAVKALALAYALASPRRWALHRDAVLSVVMLVSCACLVAMTTPHNLSLISDHYDRTLAVRALALPNLAAYSFTIWVRFCLLLPLAVACWSGAAMLALQFCADGNVAWFGLTGSRCVAAAMALQAIGCVAVPLLVRRWCERRARGRFLQQLGTRT